MNAPQIKQFLRIVVLLGLLISLLPLSSASAALVSCRTDPIFYFSDGSMVIVAGNIETDISQLTGIHYKLQVPHGLTLTKVVYTDRLRGRGETFEILANQSPSEYIIDVTVYNQGPAVNVKAQSSLVNRGSVSQIAFGMSHSPITMILKGK